MVGIVVISHSGKVAEGVKAMADQMADKSVRIIACGGIENGELGTDAIKIMEALISANSGDGVVVLVDLGSAVLSTYTALELLDEEERRLIKIADAPLVEGAVCAAVQASAGFSVDEVAAAAESARSMLKL